MNHAFHPDAESEFFEAIDYYQQQQARLGESFREEVEYAVEQFKSHPSALSGLSP